LKLFLGANLNLFGAKFSLRKKVGISLINSTAFKPPPMNPTTSFGIDIRPEISSFSSYRGEPFTRLFPYEAQFSSPYENGLTLRMNVPFPRRINIQGYSKDGLGFGKKNGNMYISISDSTEVPTGTLHSGMKNITLACVDIWRTMEKEVRAKFGIDPAESELSKVLMKKKTTAPPPLKVLIQNGLPDLVDDNKGQISQIFWPHPEYTKFYEWSGDESPREEVKSTKLQASAGYYFRLDLNLKCFEFVYYPLDKMICVKCFINVGALTWINCDLPRPQTMSTDYSDHESVILDSLKAMVSKLRGDIVVNVDTTHVSTRSSTKKRKGTSGEDGAVGDSSNES
jgi:hypothetical protein